ncbi:MAG: lipocalin-like domain-containing protein [Dysgonamonadaceae bacterium]|jgi:hypothetical protein|nr:lipocalin-like domain-containing protein [Dysgonamonadaceae bacterium]
MSQQLKTILGSFLCIPLLYSCIDFNLPLIDGMWQLKTVEDAGGKHPVDTIFYSFQYQRIFSQTVLNAKPYNPDNPNAYIYGFTDFSVKDKVTLSLNHGAEGDYWYQLLIWNVETEGETATFDIVRYNSKELILRRNGSTYNFIKF